jgi:hypothetical protein
MMAHADALEFEQAALSCATRSRRCRKVLHQQAVDNGGRRRGHPGREGAGRACLRQPGHGARRAPPGRPALLSRPCGGGAGHRRTMTRRAATPSCPGPSRPRCWRPSSPSTTWPCRAAPADHQRAGGRAAAGAVGQAGAKHRRHTSPASSAASGWRWRRPTPSCNWRACWPRRARSRPAPVRWPRRWTCRWTTWTRCASSASTFRTPPARPPRPRAWCSRATACRAPVPALHIEGITPGDDYAAMRQVLTRRYAKLAEARREQGSEALTVAPAARPGAGRRRQGQVAMAREVFESLGWTCR